MADSHRRKRKKKHKQPPQKENKGPRPRTYEWVAMGTLVAYSAVGARTIKLAGAQEALGAVALQGKSSVPADHPHLFEISPGDLRAVLPAFERATGLRIAVPDDRILSVNSPGLNGAYTRDQVLAVLLKGTGIRYEFTAPDSIRLSLAPVSQSMTVTAQEERVGLTKYSQPVVDTPQTISVVAQRIMQEQGTTTLRDALRNVAGISLAAGEGGAQGDNLTIRGFTARALHPSSGFKAWFAMTASGRCCSTWTWRSRASIAATRNIPPPCSLPASITICCGAGRTHDLRRWALLPGSIGNFRRIAT